MPKTVNVSRSPRKKNRAKYSAPALEKGLDILELFSREPGGLIKSEVARRLNRTTSEVFRMLVCLQQRGYISQCDDEKYHLTLRLFELAQRHPPTQRLTSEAAPIMHAIALRTEQSCHLAVIDKTAVIILAQVDAPSSPGFVVRAGSQVDLMLASSGFVILAHQSPYAVRNTLQLCRRQGAKVPRNIGAHLQRIRVQGYEERESYQVRGVVNLSFPVMNHNGEAIAALNVPFLPRINSPVTRAIVRDELGKGAKKLSTAMGFPR